MLSLHLENKEIEMISDKKVTNLTREIMNMMKTFVVAALMLLGCVTVSAQEAASNKEVIKIDAQQVPICYVNKTVDELRESQKELETILETENFQLYQAGDYSFKVENGIVVSQSIQFEDPKDEKVMYNKILSQLKNTKFIADSHNTGGNKFVYADFQIQFDDFQGYQKLTYSVIPTDTDLTEK